MDLPIACTLTPPELTARRQGLLGTLLQRAVERTELPDGLAWRFEAVPGRVSDIAAVIDAERVCCAFLRFELTVEPAGGAMRLAVTGPPGTREFLQTLVSAAS